MKNIKWTAKELFDSFTTETSIDEFQELYKAMLAREIGFDKYTEKVDIFLTKILEEEYWEGDAIFSYVNEDLVRITHDKAKEEEFNIDNWYNWNNWH